MARFRRGLLLCRHGWGGLGGLMLVACTAKPPPPPPDVLLVVEDTVRADALSVYGNPRPTSPQLTEVVDSAAKDAVKTIDLIHQDNIEAFTPQAQQLISERGAEARWFGVFLTAGEAV